MAKEIPLTKGKATIVDDDVYEELSKHKWLLATTTHTQEYAARCPTWKSKFILMHRVIAEAEPGEVVDHINGNGLDNRRCNLRRCTHAQNLMNRPKQPNNTSGFKGVSFRKRKDGRNWRSIITKDQTTIEKCFGSRLEAARRYNITAYKLFGEFARLNATWDEENLQPFTDEDFKND